MISVKIDGHDDILAYTSFKNYLLIEKYDENKEYEIKVRIYLDDALREWPEIKKFNITELKNSKGSLLGNIKYKNRNPFISSLNLFINNDALLYIYTMKHLNIVINSVFLEILYLPLKST